MKKKIKKTSEEHRIKNFNIFNFELSKEDMQEINKLDKSIL
jgi:diketogulonate reductase-like aldo/keto reductase